MGVVDHAGGGGAVKIGQCLSQERLALEARKTRIQLEEDCPRVAQHHRGGLHAGAHAADLGGVGGRVVLHFAPRWELVMARRRQKAVSAGYDKFAPPFSSSSYT